MHIGIDLLWVRPGICGGTESFIRNLMDGFQLYDKENQYTLFVTQDNAESFRHYADGEGEGHSRMTLEICPVKCKSPAKRIFWENRYLDKWAKETGVDIMFIPVYSMPAKTKSKIPYVSVIHDLQALHYPEYFSGIKKVFLKYTWRNTCKKADRVIAISDYCKEDLIQHYPFVKNKIETIYNPIISNSSTLEPSYVTKFGVEAKKYFYCVSSMLPHKNLKTLLKVMAEWQESDAKLVISGVGGQLEEVTACLKEYDIQDKVVLTGFVSDEERDCLYENCRLFLFPSVFEGFGMPPIEAMRKGKPVVMTKESCLQEVTMGKGIYVSDPYSIDEWKEKIQYALGVKENIILFEEYSLIKVVDKYLIMLKNTVKNNRE